MINDNKTRRGEAEETLSEDEAEGVEELAGFVAHRRSALGRLAEENKEAPDAVLAFVHSLDNPNRYLLHFRPDEILAHYRTWKDESRQSQHLYWVYVMESRSRIDRLKVWLLGEDRIGLAACFYALLMKIGINVYEKYGTVSEPEDFSVVSAHVKNVAIQETFSSEGEDLGCAMRKFAEYVRGGLGEFFGSAGNDSNQPGGRQGQPRVRTGFGSEDPGWKAFQIQALRDMPDDEPLLQTGRFCLRFERFQGTPPTVKGGPTQPQGAPEDSPSTEIGRMPKPDHHQPPMSSQGSAPGLERQPRDEGVSLPPEPDFNFFKALGDPTRLRIFRLLLASDRPLSVTELQERSGHKLTTVSESLGELKSANLVDCHRSGKFRLYFVCASRVRQHAAFLFLAPQDTAPGIARK